MLETMYHYNGVGLAAPQIGVAKRLFTALHIDKDKEKESPADAPPPSTVEEKQEQWGVVAEYVMVNPTIRNTSGKALDTEGCLSIPGLYVEDVGRPESINVEYYDLEGNKHEIETSGHFARVIQHELDHLNGVLFLDRLNTIEKRSFMDEHRSALAEMQREAKAFLKDSLQLPDNLVIN